MSNSELVLEIRKSGAEALVRYRERFPKETLDLHGAILPKTDLRGAPLFDVDLRGAYLAETDLREADLRMSNLTGANLTNVKLAGAIFCRTTATGVDFNRVEGAERIVFAGPSDLGLATIMNCDDPAVRKALIRGSGLPEDVCESLSAIRHDGKTARAVFVAYVQNDEALARWVASKLEAARMRVYMYPIEKSATWRPFRDVVHHIRRDDWVVFLASQAAMTHPLVELHIEKVIQARKLQPLALDRFLSTEWEHAMRNDMMQLRIVRFYDCETDAQKDEAVQKLCAALRRGIAEHL